MSSFPDLVNNFEESIDALKVKLSPDADASITYNGEEIKSIAGDIAEQSKVIGEVFTNAGASKVGTSSGSDVQSELNALTQNQQSGVIVFQTYALLDAYTPTTAQQKGSFKVSNDSDNSLNGYYSWVSDTTYVKDVGLVVNEIDEGNTSDAVSGHAVSIGIEERGVNNKPGNLDIDFAITDALGSVSLSVNKEGGVEFPTAKIEHLEVEVSETGGVRACGSNGVLEGFCIVDSENSIAFSVDETGDVSVGDTKFQGREGGPVFAIADSDGKMALSIHSDGSVDIPVLKVNNSIESGNTGNFPTSFKKMLNDLTTPNELLLPVLSDYTQLMIYGQSLSVGGGSPAISAPSKKHKMYNYGAFESNLSSSDMFYPLLAYDENATGYETPGAGILESIDNLIARESSPVNPTFLLSGVGVSSKRIDELTKGTVAYEGVVNMLSNGEATSELAAKGVSLGGIFWIQGENDAGSGNTSREDYLSKLLQLRIDIQSENDNQAADIPMFIYQTPPRIGGSIARMAVSNAQHDATKEDPLIFMATPIHFMTFKPDNIHLDSVSSKLLGSYLGKAWKRVIIDGEKWRPLEPISINRSRDTIDIKLRVPSLPLAIDVDAANPHCGFRVTDAYSNLIATVTGVTIHHDTVRLKLDTVITTPVTVSYATDHIGLIRDTASANEYIDIEGTKYNLHNYLIAFSQEV